MASGDLAAVERRALAAHDRAALRRAAVGASPMLVVGVVAVALARDAMPTVVLAAGVVLVSAVALWLRRGVHTAVALGFFAGLVPFVASVTASRFGGHVCTPTGCVSMCLPACTAAGAVAAVLVARAAARRRAGPLFWLAASGMTVATGALGCSCAGFAGASGMLAGYLLTVVPVAVLARLRAPRP